MTPAIKPLTCKETTYIVCDARDSPMDAQQKMQLQAHLESCQYCRIASSQLTSLFAHLDTLLARKE